MHFPGEEFERVDPGAVGLDPGAVTEAVDFHRRHGTPDEQVDYHLPAMEPFDETEGDLGAFLGPMPDRRGGPAGMGLKGGRVVAEWGDTGRVDHCFSCAKSLLAIAAGVAWDRGLFDLDDPVATQVDDGGFDSDHNRKITWRHLLQQTSEWEGTLFDRPDSIDRNRAVGKGGDLDKAETRDLREPGTFWEYNDVRINRLALSLLRVLAKPLPRVLAHEVMDPIGASRTWEWHGYHNSKVEVEGRTMESVSGGGHWGGGFWSSTRDLARVGHLLLNEGSWAGMRLLSTEWVRRATAPCPENGNYGFLFWLNTDRALWPSAPASAFAMLGHGQNVVWVDPEHDLVVVLRWLELAEDRSERDDLPNQDAFLARLLDGL